MNNELSKMIEWVTESFDMMVIKADENNELYTRLVRGLLSGWRCTSWINSVLNVAYLYNAIQSAMLIDPNVQVD